MPVDVDAVLFWKVVDPMKAALAVADYPGAIDWAAQTALRDVIGKTVFADMLEGREKLSPSCSASSTSAPSRGRQRHLGGGPRRLDPARSRGCDVDAGAGRA